ncbi:MAG: nucleotidyltransferase domain-containing protein [Alphaproteobacteria bacterium]|nr:nucleotidyltransferase domain-containing protein [Alphaproteobacteria bacterium]QQS57679.1 MAG: nucleotidyltransferase domain-containing protein [Alphaproteobacteria bacterium]
MIKSSSLIDPLVGKDIQAALARAEGEHGVRILHAAESGSRAWGFASPDSDYDVRFFYAHSRDWYLSVFPGRDVIEYPITGVFDISGWDVRKTLQLCLKSNAIVMEWLTSPIIYRAAPDFSTALKDFWLRVADRKALLHHYVNMGTRQVDQNWRTREVIAVKKYLYVLRPAMALRWLRLRGEDLRDLPMNLQELMRGCDLPEAVRGEIDALIVRKANLNEGQETGRIALLDHFAEGEFAAAEALIVSLPMRKENFSADADDFLRAWVF